MKIYYTRWGNASDFIHPNSLYLEDRNWDDYGYKTTFYLYYFTEKEEKKFIGEVKILNIDKNNTADAINKGGIDSLDDNFISLGQSKEYYKNIKNLNIRNILYKLRDWSQYSEDKKKKFKDLKGFGCSLLREWEASYILENIENLLEQDNEINLNIKFIYSKKLPGADKEHQIEFDFTRKDVLPHRIFVLIGKNGVGKTEILGNLAKDLKENKEKYFKNNIPNYRKIIYFYYGKDVDSSINFDEIDIDKIDIKEEYNNITEPDRECLKKKKVFEYTLTALKKVIGNGYFDEITLLPIKDLSSGQKVMYKLIINLLLKIEENSLIIIDELEVHLHPNMLSKIMTVIRNCLETFHSYSIMSTHSSYILQQIPSRSIRLIERIENTPIIRKIESECFGETLSEISEKIFQVSDAEAEYKQIFIKMKKEGLTQEEIENLFDNKLSFNAKVFLVNLYNNYEGV